MQTAKMKGVMKPPPRKLSLSLFLLPALLLSLAFNFLFLRSSGEGQPAPAVSLGEEVVEVVDGDTFFIGNRQPIRLYGVDAPAVEYCMGKEAKTELTNLIAGKTVVLKEPLSDHTGRVMALVYVDGTLVNEIIIRKGLALYKRQAGSETETMKQANDYARANNLGIFSPECYQQVPPDPNCAIKGNYHEGKRSWVYVRPDCRYYDQVMIEKNFGERWFCSEAEALKAGFAPSDTCP